MIFHQNHLMRLYRLLVSLCLLLFILSAAHAQERPEVLVKAVVFNSAGKRLPGEEIHFVRRDNRRVIIARSDANGTFQIKLPASAPFSVRIRTLADTTVYSDFDTPEPRQDDYALRALSIEIEFDAPRLYTLPDVLFASGTARLHAAILPTLDGIASYMRQHPAERYRISGHTDNIGAAAANKQLSEQRAQAVRAYLLRKGVLAPQLEAKGFGAEKPVAENGSEEGRRKNRRTEIAIL
ncbi:MAG: OmpA family protein [Chitinophagaceae bacterium]|nr:MAG: OmpA family protein [Chitinophagaceae bacterium]